MLPPTLTSWHPTGIPFTYRGLPCPYASALLASTFLLTGGHVALLRVAAAAMILFMADCGFYPHDRVLESQLWKKLVYAGGKDGDEPVGMVVEGKKSRSPRILLLRRGGDCPAGSSGGGCGLLPGLGHVLHRLPLRPLELQGLSPP